MFECFSKKLAENSTIGGLLSIGIMLLGVHFGVPLEASAGIAAFITGVTPDLKLSKVLANSRANQKVANDDDTSRDQKLSS